MKRKFRLDTIFPWLELKQTHRMKSICVCMIVRDEEARISHALQSIKTHQTKLNIKGCLIIDTGSSDKTQEVVKNVLAVQPEIVLKLIESPWKDFATNRNEYLQNEFVKQYDYILTLDGDEVINLTHSFCGLSELLDVNLIQIEEAQGQTHFCPYIISTGANVKYEGVVHETLVLCDEATHIGKFFGIKIAHSCKNDSDETTIQSKTLRDIELITRALKTDHLKLPLKFRYQFYLALSFKTLLKYENSAMTFKDAIETGMDLKRATLASCPSSNELVDHLDEVIWKCKYEMAQVEFFAKFTGAADQLCTITEDGVAVEAGEIDEVSRDLEKNMRSAFRWRPQRAEPLAFLMSYYNEKGFYEQAYRIGLVASQIPFPQDELLTINEFEYRVIVPSEFERAKKILRL